MDLAVELGPGQWALADMLEPTLRQLGERGDIIKRPHRSMTEVGIKRDATSLVLASERMETPVLGRLVARGLDDELTGTAYAIIDGTDGRVHHVRFADLDSSGDSAPGSIVEVKMVGNDQPRAALVLRSDIAIEDQITAKGATWLDRQAVAREPSTLAEIGFGAKVQDAMHRRAEHLIGEGLARRHGEKVNFSSNLIETLRQRELGQTVDRITAETDLDHRTSATGEFVSGTVRQRLQLASGRFAVINDGLGFQLVPWSKGLEKQVGRHVRGIMRGDRGVDWQTGRGLGR